MKFWACCLIVVLVGCARESGNLENTTVRDSAGVRIVELSLRRSTAFGLSRDPLVELSASGDSLREFSHVWDGAFLSDGSVAVINGITNQVRVFTADGGSVVQFGGTGHGPGEFQFAQKVFVLSDDQLGGVPRFLDHRD